MIQGTKTKQRTKNDCQYGQSSSSLHGVPKRTVAAVVLKEKQLKSTSPIKVSVSGASVMVDLEENTIPPHPGELVSSFPGGVIVIAT